MKIWHQSLTSIEEVIPYRDAVLKHIDRVARPGVEVVLHGMSKDTYPSHYPGHFITYSYLQNLHREQFVRAALMAESAGYDAMFIGTIPDVGLLEARTLVDIPGCGLRSGVLPYGIDAWGPYRCRKFFGTASR